MGIGTLRATPDRRIGSGVRPTATTIPRESGLQRGNARLLRAAQLLPPAAGVLRTVAWVLPTGLLSATFLPCSLDAPALRAAAWLLSRTPALLCCLWGTGVLSAGRFRLSPLVSHTAVRRSARDATAEDPRVRLRCSYAIES